MENVVRISVRTLVEYVFRSGSLETGFRTNTSLIEGTRAHQKIQKTYKETDQKEVYLQIEIPFKSLIIKVDGRCDGLLLHEDGSIVIEEIKSTSRSLEEITEETHPVHWAQAIFYGYMYASEHELREINIQLTYVQVQSEEQKNFYRKMSFQELESYVLNVIEKYAPYAITNYQHIENRNKSVKGLNFPFENYRNGQRKLAGAVYKSIIDKKSLFAKASTGIGKTISTIFPSVKAIGEGELQKIFYLTAKTITRTAAEEAFCMLIEKGLDIQIVTITAKEKSCSSFCTEDYHEGFYDRINDAVLDILANEKLMTRTVIEKYARKHLVCPFEFSLELTYIADVVICDYNYIFDPRVSLKRLFEEQKKETVLLIDEAHNLVDRAREMYSAELYKSSFLKLKQMIPAAKEINKYLLELKKQENYLEKALDEELVTLLDSFISQAEIALMDQEDELLLETYFAAQNFVKIAKLYDERFVTYMETWKSEVKVKLFCLDPSYLIQKMGKGFKAKIFFSATLIPGDYYKNLLGGGLEDYVISIPSPFARENAEVFIQPLSTRFRDRESSMDAMVHFMCEVIRKKSGNYLIFFPSYKYMHSTYEKFQQNEPEIKTIVQDVGMSEVEREDFLGAFQADSTETLVGFAVLGGIFSEGVDLKGDRLHGVIVVGVGLPQICLERDIMKGYFQTIGRNGYDYAYLFPGMNKVLQAGGRLIRSESDKGTIVLIDDRFLQKKYQALLPYEWQHFKVVR